MNIRRFCEKDIDYLCKWFSSDDEVLQWGGINLSWPLTKSQVIPMLQEANESPPKRWMFIGFQDSIRLAHAQIELDWLHGVALLGRVVINPDYRKKGLAVPFLQRIIDEVFSRLEFQRLELNVYSFNKPAIKTYQRLGFIQEGIRRSAVKATNERWDDIMFSMLRNEYLNINKLD
ncbi:GNAT family protein [Arsenophonus sp.]|uniref:GNAT family N-acetyltransferase n=1 Tax=Arsenophonus sp. TaxID=1872640 RepID=UPI00285DC275|nr:GNAT family protein [Arsenophonus sp.]MDR5615156.1 GNAT family protein [Arsenophonus sp.]